MCVSNKWDGGGERKALFNTIVSFTVHALKYGKNCETRASWKASSRIYIIREEENRNKSEKTVQNISSEHRTCGGFIVYVRACLLSICVNRPLEYTQHWQHQIKYPWNVQISSIYAKGVYCERRRKVLSKLQHFRESYRGQERECVPVCWMNWVHVNWKYTSLYTKYIQSSFKLIFIILPKTHAHSSVITLIHTNTHKHLLYTYIHALSISPANKHTHGYIISSFA